MKSNPMIKGVNPKIKFKKDIEQRTCQYIAPKKKLSTLVQVSNATIVMALHASY